MKRFGKNKIGSLVLIAVFLIVLNFIGNFFYQRFDLTQDKRFTLSEASKDILQNVQSPMVIDVFLKGNFPPEFRRLQKETEQLLDEFSAHNSNVRFVFIDPMADDEDSQKYQEQITEMQLAPAQVSVSLKGKQSTELVYPWAIGYFNGKTVKIPLLKSQMGATSEERVNSSLQNLEYAFADAFKKLSTEKSKKVAVLKGNGEYEDKYIADYFSTLKDYYFIAPFTLDSVASYPQKTLDDLKFFDLVVIAQPTIPFDDAQKYVLDQYIMSGGATLWLMDATEMRMDPESGNYFAFGKDLNLNDFFFRYGIRINPNLIKDVYSAPIVLESGDERQAQRNMYPWFFSPLSTSNNNHPIVNNIEAVKFDYASSIDTLPNEIKKTVLLSSSPISKIIGVPFEINFDVEIPENLQIIDEGPNLNDFRDGESPLAVLLEGKFTSAFKNRVKPFTTQNQDEGKATKMVVISDGDIIKNQLQGNKPLELGYDKTTKMFYGNKEFLLNTANYLLEDNGLINIRTRQIAVPFLDPQKIVEQHSKWEVLNLVLPLVLLGSFGAVFTYYRKRKYKA